MKQFHNRRYNLHWLLKTKHPDDYRILNIKKRTFYGTPKSSCAKKLIKEYKYTIQTSI